MSEHIEIDLYQFIKTELSEMEGRLNKRFEEVDTRSKEMEARLNKRIDDTEARFKTHSEEMEARFEKRFDKLEEEVRWPRRIAVGGVITTVIAVLFAIIGWQGVLTP